MTILGFLALGALIVCVLVAVWYVVYYQRSSPATWTEARTNDQLREGAAVEAPAPDTTSEAFAALEALNLQLRLDLDLAAEVVAQVEGLIDHLSGLLPQLNADYAHSELAYVANRMATDYLPELVGRYLLLGPVERAAQTEELRRMLTGLQVEVETIAQLVASRQVNDFARKAKFLRHKFFGEAAVEA